MSTDDVVLEIGAGSGRITAALARRARRVIAVELAPDLARGFGSHSAQSQRSR